MRYVVFTDLDGTLLDIDDFSFAPAEPVLRRLRDRGIPLIIVTSKTLAEVAPLVKELGVSGPVVIESGGAIAMNTEGDEWAYVPLGATAHEIRELVPTIEHLSGARILLYTQMSPEEAELLSGLSGGALERSMKREFDEPFLLAEGNIQAVSEAAETVGLTVRHGGRFHHLCGRSGKGDAVKKILEAFEDAPLTIALGDAPMDADFLALADIPIIIRGTDGLPNETLLAKVPHATIAPDTGPHGWAQALEDLLDFRSKENDAHGPN